MLKLILLIATSIITARFLEKRYRVAYIAHTVLFFFFVVLFMFDSGIPAVENGMIRLVGEKYYFSLHNALGGVVSEGVNYGIGAILIFEITLFILLPLLSIVIFVKEAREQFKKLKYDISWKDIIRFFIPKVFAPNKEHLLHSDNIYLLFGKFLN